MKAIFLDPDVLPPSFRGTRYAIYVKTDGRLYYKSAYGEEIAVALQSVSTVLWGNITGVLANQTDLAVALASKPDIELGNWTPSLGGGATYIVNSGRYIKIGKLVYIQGSILVNTIGFGSTTIVSGLPFPVVDSPAFAVSSFSNLATAIVYICGLGLNSTIAFRSLVAASINLGSSAIFKNTARVDFSGTYETS